MCDKNASPSDALASKCLELVLPDWGPCARFRNVKVTLNEFLVPQFVQERRALFGSVSMEWVTLWGCAWLPLRFEVQVEWGSRTLVLLRSDDFSSPALDEALTRALNDAFWKAITRHLGRTEQH